MKYDENQLYLLLLSNLMQESAEEVSEASKLFSELYSQINETLFEWLSHSQYPDSASLIQDLNQPLGTLENLLLCPELHHKCVVRVESAYPLVALRSVRGFFSEDLPEELFSLKDKIPVLIANGNGFSVSAMTYADKRVSFSVSELSCVVKQAQKYSLNLGGMVKYFVVTTPVKVPESVILLDNHKQTGNQLFNHFINYHLQSNEEAITSGKISEWIQAHINYQYYGIRDIFSQKMAELLSFYYNRISQDSQLERSLTDDLIRLGSSHQHISELRENTRQHLKLFEKEYQELQGIIKKFSGVILKIENLLDNTPVKCDAFSEFSYDTALECLFTYTEAEMFENAEEYVNRLENMKYPLISVVKSYFSHMKNHTFVPAESLGNAEHWASAKMAVAISDPDSWNGQNAGLVKEWMNQIQRPALTGKEMYAMAFIHKADKNQVLDWLNRSASAGYVPAMAWLLELYRKGENVDLQFLANMLYPEACMILGDDAIQKSNGAHYIDSDAMLYYKLSASAGNAPAVGKIVDIIYQEHFSDVPNLSQTEENLKENAEILILLCTWLKENHYQPMHFTEILGILQYCTGQYSQAIRTLSGINTPASNYCKGAMYESGDGVSRDYEQAISHYSKAGTFKDAWECIKRVRNQKSVQEQEEEKEEVYQPTQNYHATNLKTYNGSSGGCFITTASAVCLQKGDDCEELNLMRKFRDEYVCNSEKGQELVLEYYRIAPLILEKLNQESDAEEIYHSIWCNDILPSIDCMNSGNPAGAQEIYIRMVKKLAERFGVKISDYIQESYSLN